MGQIKNNIIEYDDYAEIILLNNKKIEVGRAMVDLDDVNKIRNIKWHLKNTGYASSTINHKTTLLHRFIMNLDINSMIDHINHNRLDNRKSNLRVCTNQENMMNSSKPKNNTSGKKIQCIIKIVVNGRYK